MHQTKFSLKISYLTHVWLAELDKHRISKPVIVGVVSLILTGGNLIVCCNFSKIPQCQFCKKKPQKCQICIVCKNLNLCHLTSIIRFLYPFVYYSLR